MGIVFVHVSDIHFGQEKGGQSAVDGDVKNNIIEDCRKIFLGFAPDRIGGVIATGDIAFGGKKDQYDQAGLFLDALTEAIGTNRTSVFIVPGNHDIDRAKISLGCDEMLDKIAAEGDKKLDAYLLHDADRAHLLERFEAYALFAHAYDCPLDDVGGLAGDHVRRVSQDKSLRFVGLNSALICGLKDKKGELLLGKRQRTLPMKRDGEELVVLLHHPLEWASDSSKASPYFESRARVVISGHEHAASARVVPSTDGLEILMISAGATIPPESEGQRYCYNIIEFDWDAEQSKLVVKVTPRQWSEKTTCFVPGTEELGGVETTYRLACAGTKVVQLDSPSPNDASPEVEVIDEEPMVTTSPTDEDKAYSLLVLRFFRDLTSATRVSVLSSLRILPENWNGPLTHGMERMCLDRARKEGRIHELKVAIDAATNEKEE